MISSIREVEGGAIAFDAHGAHFQVLLRVCSIDASSQVYSPTGAREAGRFDSLPSRFLQGTAPSDANGCRITALLAQVGSCSCQSWPAALMMAPACLPSAAVHFHYKRTWRLRMYVWQRRAGVIETTKRGWGSSSLAQLATQTRANAKPDGGIARDQLLQISADRTGQRLLCQAAGVVQMRGPAARPEPLILVQTRARVTSAPAVARLSSFLAARHH